MGTGSVTLWFFAAVSGLPTVPVPSLSKPANRGYDKDMRLMQKTLFPHGSFFGR